MDISKYLDMADMRAILALILTLTCIGLMAFGRPVPEFLVALTSTAVGFFYGERTANGKES